jgi:3-oxoacyl-[acyl-carrier protein] reductase
VPTAVVTGAGSGIGRAIALALGRRGLDVALVGRTASTLRETAAEIDESRVKTVVAVADVRSTAEVERAAAEIARSLGTPRVLVHNAGIAGRKSPIEQLTDADLDEVIATNLRSLFVVTRAFLPAMRAERLGRIVTVASISSTLGSPGLAPYAASKWGAVGFTKSLAEELRGSGLQAMAVLPGSVDTPMVKIGGFPPQMAPTDVAGVVAYLALDAPDAMNGSSVECFGP